MAPSEPTGASGSPAGTPAPAPRGRARTGSGACDHRVQFYEDDAFLVEIVAGYLAEGHAAGDTLVAFATPAHRAAITLRLRAAGVDVERAVADGALLLLDATARCSCSTPGRRSTTSCATAAPTRRGSAR